MTDVTATSESKSLESEAQVVFHTLEEALNELYPPLDDLVHGQLKRVFAPERAMVILAAGVDELDRPELREQRIYVTSALEMLHLALSIHKLLITDSHLYHIEDAEKSRIGSIILAGDYCFSRSAILAACTNNPQVVEQFASALKTVSEGHLRTLFQKSDTFQEEPVLIEAGLAAAAKLTKIGPESTEAIIEFGKQVLLSAVSGQQPDRAYLSSLLLRLPPWQQTRWQGLLSRYTLSSTDQR